MRAPLLAGLAALALTSAACETVVDVEVPAYEPQLVVYGLLQPDSLIALTLWKSVGLDYTASGDGLRVLDAVAAVTDAAGRRHPLQHVGGGYYVADGIRAAAGETYLLDASAPGFGAVTAEAFVPPRPVLRILEASASADPVNPHRLGGTLRFRLQDPPGETVYHLTLSVTDTVTFSQPGDTTAHRQVRERGLSFRTLDPSFRSGYLDDGAPEVELDGPTRSDFWGSALIDDDLFRDQTRTFELSITDTRAAPPDPADPLALSPPPISLRLAVLSPDYYRYEHSRLLQDSRDGSPFADPVNVYTNVEGGLGFFAGASASTYELRLLSERAE